MKRERRTSWVRVVALILGAVACSTDSESDSAGGANPGSTDAATDNGSTTDGGTSTDTGGGNDSSSNDGGGVVGKKCTAPTNTLPANPADPQDGVTLSGYYVATDTWNFANYPGSQQTMYICDFDNWYAMVNVDDSKADGAVKTYPNVHKDYDSPLISSFTAISSKFAHTAPATGDWNYAYDIWLDSYDVELMIWTQSAGKQAHVPSVPVSATVTLSGITYDIHHEGTYTAYDMKTTLTSGTLNLLEIMNDMITRGFITNTATLAQIDYGVEVCNTNSVETKFEVNDFGISTQ